MNAWMMIKHVCYSVFMNVGCVTLVCSAGEPADGKADTQPLLRHVWLVQAGLLLIPWGRCPLLFHTMSLNSTFFYFSFFYPFTHSFSLSLGFSYLLPIFYFFTLWEIRDQTSFPFIISVCILYYMDWLVCYLCEQLQNCLLSLLSEKHLLVQNLFK